MELRSASIELELFHLELVSNGHDVIGMTRSRDKIKLLQQMGAIAVVADALNVESLLRVVSEAVPTHIVDLLIAFPDSGPIRLRDRACRPTLPRAYLLHL